MRYKLIDALCPRPNPLGPIPKRTSLNREGLYSNLRVQLGRFELLKPLILLLLPSSFFLQHLLYHLNLATNSSFHLSFGRICSKVAEDCCTPRQEFAIDRCL